MINWYKTSQNTQQIEQIANQVRTAIVSGKDDETLAALCLPVSRHLAKIYMDNGFPSANVVQGTFRIDNPDPSVYDEWNVEDFGGDEEAMESAQYTPLHYWVQVGHLMVDITADQFNDELDEDMPPIFISSSGTSDRHITIQEDFIEPRIMF